MKKIMLAMAVVLCLGLASCSEDCKCKVTKDKEVITQITISEETLQKAGVTCEQYAEIEQVYYAGHEIKCR